MFQEIIFNLPKGSTILELGSGKGSAELNRYYNLYSIEHSKHFVGMYDTNYIYAPSPDNPPNDKSWYDPEIIKANMPKYDLLLIDGPNHTNRRNLLDHMSLFDWSKPVIVDDMQEPDLLELGKTIANEFCQRDFKIVDCQEKKFMVIP